MEKEIEVRKIAVEPRASIPAIAVTAIVMAIALGAIIVLQKYVNTPDGTVNHSVEQSVPR